jgi:hypothetical protein
MQRGIREYASQCMVQVDLEVCKLESLATCSSVSSACHGAFEKVAYRSTQLVAVSASWGTAATSRRTNNVDGSTSASRAVTSRAGTPLLGLGLATLLVAAAVPP